MCSHIRLKGNTNTVDKVTAILDGSTHSEFKSFGENNTNDSLLKKNIHLHLSSSSSWEGSSCAVDRYWSLRQIQKHDVLISIYVSIPKAPNGTRSPGRRRPRPHRLRKRPCNPTSKKHKQYKNTVIYTRVSTWTRLTKSSHLRYQVDDYLWCLKGACGWDVQYRELELLSTKKHHLVKTLQKHWNINRFTKGTHEPNDNRCKYTT